METGNQTGANLPILQRRATRRAVVGATAALAAAGAAAAIIAVAPDGPPPASTDPAPPDATGEGASATVTAAANTATRAATSTPATAAAPFTAFDDPVKRAAHLLRRAGFGGTRAEVEAFAKLSREDGADRLLNYAATENGALDARIAAAQFVLRVSDEDQMLAGRAIRDMQRWWLTRMSYTARPLEERMTFIWHGLLTSQVSRVGARRSRILVDQNDLFRSMALGRYDDLIQMVAKDPAMMVYLDTIESTKEHPNENFPRELLELFTMGAGSYTENDVREASRAFTGWRLSLPPPERADYDPTFEFRLRQHDSGQKTFLGQTGAWGGEQIIAIIMGRAETGRFLCARLWREFAYGDPEPHIIERLAKVWQASGHQVKDVVRAILTSPEFYSERAYFGKVRSPVEFVTGVVRGLEIETAFDFPPARGGARGGSHYQAMGQVLFEPPNVAGWPGGAAWLSSGAFFARLNVLDQLLFRNGRAIPLPSLSGLATPAALVDEIANRLTGGALSDAKRREIAAYAGTLRDPAERAATAAYLVGGSPEFQLI